MRKYVGTLIIVVALLLPVSLTVGAQDGPERVEAEVFGETTPVMQEAEEFAEPPPLTEEQLAALAWAEENTPGQLPVIEGEQAEVVGPEPGTESMESDVRGKPGQPLAPGTLGTYAWYQFGGSIPANQSNIMEPTLDGKARYLFYAGNKFAARSLNKGASWSYLSPWGGMADFCCDQIVRHDLTRNIFLWLRMGVPDGGGNNRFALSVSFNTPFTGSYWTYFIAPTNVNSGWAGTWWDYPAMALTADYLYISWNMFDAGGNYVRSVALRYSLDLLAAAATIPHTYMVTDWGSPKFVDGADHTMYFASNWPSTLPQNSRLMIWRWRDKDNFLNAWSKTVAAWNFTKRGTNPAHCGSPNWMARLDQRILAGARYNVDSSTTTDPGRNVLAWWWNVREGGSWSRPYIDGAVFYEDTIIQVAGSGGRPYVYNPDLCFAFPDVASNQREDLGMVFNWAEGPNFHRPLSGYAVADDYVHNPPGWVFRGVAGSSAGPSDQVWGDYNTTRTNINLTTWIAGVHYIPGGSNCSNCSVPVYFSYGRERDLMNYWYW